MIIWGTRNKVTSFAHGSFFCPKCHQQRNYSRMRVASCFHIYFISLGSGRTVDEYVVCDTCRSQYTTSVLSKNAAWYASLSQSWTCPSCKNANPGGNDECLKCHRWVCSHCKYDNPSSAQECLRCLTERGGARYHH